MSEAKKSSKPDYRSLRITRHHSTTLEDLSEENGQLFRVVEYSPGGELLSDVEYDEDGNEVEKYLYIRDEKDKLIERKHLSFGDELDRQTYEYDEKGQLIKEVRHYLEGEAGYTAYAYNENGKLIEKKIIESDDEPVIRETTEYHDKWTDEVIGHCEYIDADKRVEVRHILQETDGKPDVAETIYTHVDLRGPRKIVFHNARTNDDNLYAVTYDELDRVVEIHRVYYDEKGRKEKEAVKNGETSTITETNFEYDENDRVSREERVVNGQLSSRAEARYDEKGRITHQLISFSGGYYTDVMVYEE